jgi:hypothetical protein
LSLLRGKHIDEKWSNIGANQNKKLFLFEVLETLQKMDSLALKIYTSAERI